MLLLEFDGLGFVLFFEGLDLVPLVLEELCSFGVEVRDGFVELGLELIGTVLPFSELLCKGLLDELRL